MLVCPILNAERKKKVWESKEVYFTHCRVIVGTKQRKTALISSTRQNEAKKKKKLSKTTDVHPAFSTTSTVSQVQEHSHLTPGSALQDYGAHWSAVVYRWERKSQDTIVSGWWGGGGEGAGRGKDPHLAVFASAKQKSHLHSWCMHEETSSLTLSHTHAPELIMSLYQHNQHYVQENDKFSISGSVDIQKKVRNGWWWR